eukprot:GEMP01037975.1.p1 GENE.GEMP01037975.1~~GEMP01037975.1.p1  ORF type:complete len:445 (+),score=94.90 GEMP01037975.1:167-1501(+)
MDEATADAPAGGKGQSPQEAPVVVAEDADQGTDLVEGGKEAAMDRAEAPAIETAEAEKDADDIVEPAKSGQTSPHAVLAANNSGTSIFDGMGLILLNAIKENEWSRAQGMIMGGVELTATDSRGQSALHAACWKGAVGVVRLLLERSAPVDAVDRVYRVTALHVACSRRHELIVRQFIDGAADVNLVGIDGDTPLSRAAGRGDIEICRRLLEAAANPDPDFCATAKTDTHSSPRSPQLPISEASNLPTARSQRSFTPRRGRSRSPDRLVQQPSRSALLTALKRNVKFQVVQLLCENMASLNAVDQRGNTPLHIAAFHGNANVVKVLLKRESGLEMTNSQLRRPLHYAARNGDLRVIKMLVKYKANVCDEDCDGVTPLMCCGDPCGRKLLKDLGATESEHWAEISPPMSPVRYRSQSPRSLSRGPSIGDRASPKQIHSVTMNLPS